jgi:FKBP-type peptidyl-prolyl cis-trans isomerase
MNRNLRNTFSFTLVFIISVILGCSRTETFQETSTGLKYKFHVQSKDAQQVHRYELVDVLMNYRTKDSILYQGGLSPISFQVNPIVDGDLQEGILMMRLGDSATFALNPEKFFISMMKYSELPDLVKDQTEIFFDVKLVGIRPEPPMMQAERLENIKRKETEAVRIAQYIAENNITVSPTSSGLYFIEINKGSGKEAAAGMKVKVHYRGMFLEGNEFDSSYGRNRPVEFILGKGERLPAWDEAIAMMSVGGKARIIVPSALGYGAEQRNTIKPYTPLVFEVELLEVSN